MNIKEIPIKFQSRRGSKKNVVIILMKIISINFFLIITTLHIFHDFIFTLNALCSDNNTYKYNFYDLIIWTYK